MGTNEEIRKKLIVIIIKSSYPNGDVSCLSNLKSRVHSLSQLLSLAISFNLNVS